MPIAGEVAIVGAASTAFGVHHDRSYLDLLAEAADGRDRRRRPDGRPARLGLARDGGAGADGPRRRRRDGCRGGDRIRPAARHQGRELLLHRARGGAGWCARRRRGRAHARPRGRRGEDARRAEPRQPRRAHRQPHPSDAREGAHGTGPVRTAGQPLHGRVRRRPGDARARGGQEPRACAAQPEGALPQGGDGRAGARRAAHRRAVRDARLHPDDRRRCGGDPRAGRVGAGARRALRRRSRLRARRDERLLLDLLRPGLGLPRLPLDA